MGSNGDFMVILNYVEVKLALETGPWFHSDGTYRKLLMELLKYVFQI